ncbi:MAG: TonB-dependent receptor plug domain-containing protein, partial [Burkholderia sp.]|nr:TonB-dependent receptor plug domain-containing protein [Burkholderia sp.]
ASLNPATPLAVLAALLAMPAAQVQAQTQTQGSDPDDSIVVTASRTGADAGVSVAGREAVARRQPATLLDILDELPGVTAFQTGGPAGGSFLTIRGGEPNFTTVLVEGGDKPGQWNASDLLSVAV